MATASSDLLERLSVTFKDNAKLIATCQDIAARIQSGQIKLCTFVEELRPILTNKDVNARERGILAMSVVLEQISKDFLNESELQFITAFYCDRLKDHHNVIPAILQGILAIVQMKNLPQDGPSRLLRAMFEHVNCQSQLLPDRRNIYLILSALLQNRSKDLKDMGPDFVYGFISSIDGERDPRNLILLFNLLPNFMKEFPLGHLTEEMFEVIACYFPVDFNPPNKETLKITRDELAEALAPCLYAIPQFAEFCIPLIVDKLFSNLKTAKVDSLDLLCKGSRTFGVKGLEDHLNELWSVLRKEVMPGADTELAHVALKAVATIVDVLSEDVHLQENFVDKIITDTKSTLCDVQLSLFKPAVKLLETVAAVNKESCIQVLRTIVPLCLGQYSTKTALNDKVILMDTLNTFIKIAAEFGFCIKSVAELAWTDIPQLYLNELGTPSMELKSKVLIGLAAQKAFLSEIQRTTTYNAIHNEIETGSSEIRNVCHMSLVIFASLYLQEVLMFVKEKLSLEEDGTTVEILIRRLEALTAIAKTEELCVELVPKIVDMTTVPNLELSSAALNCLQRLVTTKNVRMNIQHFLYRNCNIIEKLIAVKTEASDLRLHLIMSICQSVVRNLSVEEQQTIVDKNVIRLKNTFVPVDITLTMGLFIPLQQSVNFIIDNSLIDSLFELAVTDCCCVLNLTSCKLLSVLLNKMSNVDGFQNVMSYLTNRIVNSLESSEEIKVKEKSITLLIWLTKAAVMKGSANSQDLLNLLCNFLGNEEVGRFLAQEYKILVNKVEDTLTEEHFCNIKIFYKQRVFQHLIQQDNKFRTLSRQNYLVALTHLLEEVPVELLFMQLTELVPLLIESLSLNNDHLVLSALTTLKLLLETINAAFINKADCFIPLLLKLSKYKMMAVRIAALDCLTSYCNYPVSLLLPYKNDVLDALIPVLDDRKRLVRKSAVKARTRWFLIDAPGGLKE